MFDLPEDLHTELTEGMTLGRISSTGFFQRLPVMHESFRPDLELFRAILDRALVDSFSAVPTIREEAEAWLEIGNPDYLEICNNADLEPELVMKAFKYVQEILKDK